MFGPGVSTKPNEIRAKPSKVERWGIWRASMSAAFLMRGLPEIHSEQRTTDSRNISSAARKSLCLPRAFNCGHEPSDCDAQRFSEFSVGDDRHVVVRGTEQGQRGGRLFDEMCRHCFEG